MHFQILFRGFTYTEPQIWHEGTKGSDNFKYNIEIQNSVTLDHL